MNTKSGRSSGKKSTLYLSRSDIVFVMIVFLLLGAIAGTVVMPAKIIEVKREVVRNIAVPQGGERHIEMNIPAVDNSGNGVVGKLITIVKPGTGRIFFDVTSVLGQPDTQESGRVAASVASQYANADLNSYDIFYTIEVNASVIEGPSAGAAMAVSVALGMQNKTPNPSVVITGIIAEDGRIMPVGAVKQKAIAAKEAGATKVLVPMNMSMETQTAKQKQCVEQRLDGYTIQKCEITYSPEDVSIGNDIGMEVVEVATIADAVREFTETEM